MGSDIVRPFSTLGRAISIHAPRVGSDDFRRVFCSYGFRFQSTLPAWGATFLYVFNQTVGVISIHAPRVGSDPWLSGAPYPRLTFQSTLPAWGATLAIGRAGVIGPFQSTLPAWGATDSACKTRRMERISIHAPRVGSDAHERAQKSRHPFQSTLPAWGATRLFRRSFEKRDISIHAPRVGSDHFTERKKVFLLHHFNPRSPRGERRFFTAAYT